MTKHTLSVECENGRDIISTVDETGLMMDVKYLINEYYLATFSETGNSLDIAFNNGQKFRLTVNEIK